MKSSKSFYKSRRKNLKDKVTMGSNLAKQTVKNLRLQRKIIHKEILQSQSHPKKTHKKTCRIRENKSNIKSRREQKLIRKRSPSIRNKRNRRNLSASTKNKKIEIRSVAAKEHIFQIEFEDNF